MRDMFPEYNNSRPINYPEIWRDALFVFDTNVLLNLYRYRVDTRDELLNVLNEISDRIWIPYQVALEFQRNRLNVIAEQVKRFNEVRRSINKAKTDLANDLAKFRLQERHSLINTQLLMAGFEKLTEGFFDDLDNIEKSQQTIHAEDKLKDRLELLFQNRVGSPFTKQSEIDNIQKDGELRYKNKIPPGYEDDQKDSKEPDEFFHAGLTFKRKYGDLILWKQMLSYCKDAGKCYLIFVTDDAKSDWWRIVEQDGPKKIGPRAELIDEARREANIHELLMYSPDKFLQHAKIQLKSKISADSIQEIKDISETIKTAGRKAVEDALYTKEIFKQWLSERYDHVFESSSKTGFVVPYGDSSYVFVMAVYKLKDGPIDFYEHSLLLYAGAIFGQDPDSQSGRVCIFWITSGPLAAEGIRMSLAQGKENKKSGPLGFDVIIATMSNSGEIFINHQLNI
jgi:predicted nucleic acid-binding protein